MKTILKNRINIIVKYFNSLILIIVFPLWTIAQDTAKSQVIIFTDCDSPVVRIGEQKISEVKKPFQFYAGTYVIRFWAPGRELVTDSIRILPGQMNVIRKKLPLTDDFKNYLKQDARLKRPYKISLIASCGIALLYGFNFYEMTHFKNNTQDAYEKYIQSEILTDLQTNYNNYESNKSKYNRHRVINNALLIGGGILIPSALIWSNWYYKKRTKPFKPNEILLTKVVPVININYSSTDEIGFIMNF